MFLSMQSLNGDSYQGAQVGANVQSQVGPTIKDSSWLNQRRELSLSCLCTEPSTVQSEAPKVKPNKKKKKENRQWAKARCRCEGTSNYDLCYHHQLPIGWQCCLFRFGWNILAAKIYSHPPAITPPSNSLVTIPNVCRSIWLWLELLGWYWVVFCSVLFFCFFTVSPPFFCIPILLSHPFIVCCCCLPYCKFDAATQQTRNLCSLMIQGRSRSNSHSIFVSLLSLLFFHRHRSKCNTFEHASDAGVSSLH